MKHIKTVNKANLKETCAKGGCGNCQASCQSACKTSCTVANQKCEREAKFDLIIIPIFIGYSFGSHKGHLFVCPLIFVIQISGDIL